MTIEIGTLLKHRFYDNVWAIVCGESTRTARVNDQKTEIVPVYVLLQLTEGKARLLKLGISYTKDHYQATNE